MIAGSLAIKCSPSFTGSSSLVFESIELNSNFNGKSNKFKSIISCNNKSSNSNNNGGLSNNNGELNKIPKLEPFSRSKFDRAAKDPPLIDKSEAQLSDYCSTLEGENSYNCWQAYFELKDLEKESTKEEVEKLIIEAGGVKSLIGCLHGVAAIRKANKEHDHDHDHDHEREELKTKSTSTSNDIAAAEKRNHNHHHLPDGGLPKTAEEIEEEEKAMMPDSDFTRLLRQRGKHAAWYSPTPDHQTD